MTEKVLKGKKNGMLVLILTLALYVVAGLGLALGLNISDEIIGVALIVICGCFL